MPASSRQDDEPVGASLSEAEASRAASDVPPPVDPDLGEILAIPACGIEVSELYGLVVDRAERILAVDRVAVFELDPETGSLRARTSRGFPRDELAAWTIEPGEGLVGEAFRGGQRLTAREPTGNDPFLARFASPLALAIPLRAEDEVAGVLYLGRRSGTPLTERERLLLGLLVDRCGTALIYHRLLARLGKQADRLRELAAVPAVVGIREPLQATLARTCEAGCRALGATAAVVQAQVGAEVVRASYGLDEPELADWPLEGEGAGQPDRPAVRSAGERGLLVVPLPGGERPLGQVYFLDRAERRFTQDDVRAGELVGAMMAGAVENARAFEEAQAALRQLSAAQEQLIQAEKARALSGIAGGIAHEFNNLLAIILGKTQLALERTESTSVREDLGVIEETAWRAADTVRRLLAFVAEPAEEGMAPVDLNALAQDVVTFTRALWKNDAEARGIKIEVVTDLTDSLTVHGIATELREALTNVILNAIDAMPRGGRITIRTRRREQAVELTVCDTGEGMSAEVQSRVFDPFFTTRSPQRAGLGLSVVHGIIGRHHGRIEVESEEGHGATFTLVLPEARAPQPVWSLPAAPTPRPAETGSVLVIEDEEHLRRMLIDALAAAGHTVEGAPNGLEGLARFQRGAFDVVITDLSMPECSGLDVTRAVKKMSPTTPVVMITGWGDVMTPERMGSSGVDLILVKPFKMERVLSVLADALGLRHAR
jgi:signal transduction histidine kinase